MPGKPYPENESEVQYEEWNRFRGPIDLSSQFAYPLFIYFLVYLSAWDCATKAYGTDH